MAGVSILQLMRTHRLQEPMICNKERNLQEFEREELEALFGLRELLWLVRGEASQILSKRP